MLNLGFGRIRSENLNRIRVSSSYIELIFLDSLNLKCLTLKRHNITESLDALKVER